MRARNIPAVGGEIIRVGAAAAYAGLPDAVKARIDTLNAELMSSRALAHATDEKRAELALMLPPVRHPIVRTHSESGEKVRSERSLSVVVLKLSGCCDLNPPNFKNS